MLSSEIAKRGVKKSAIAAFLDLSERAFYNKLMGVSSFSWDEACAIRDNFFPDMDKDDLFARINPTNRTA